MNDHLSYAKSGINIDQTDAVKRRMKDSIDRNDPRVLNAVGAFGSLVEGRFPGYDQPILVLKTEEPGSKQKLAFRYGRAASIAYDLINHLINDIIVMGAEPIYAQDCIVCGKLDPETVGTLVDGMAEACAAQGCVLTGGETSVQPGVIPDGEYVLSASAIGVVDRERIVDGSAISAGDPVIAVASNGLHTNGYTLVRKLLEMKPALRDRDVGGESFFDVVMRPHTCYYPCVRGLFGTSALKGMAHVTGGGVRDNLGRILPNSVDAVVDLAKLRVPEIFSVIRAEGGVPDDDMLRTFNMGAGLTVVTAADSEEAVISHLTENGSECYTIGRVAPGGGQVRFEGRLRW